MLELKYQFTGHVSLDVVVRLSDIKQARPGDSSAPWDIHVSIVWGGEVAFDNPLSGVDPLHAVEVAVKFSATYINGRALDEGGSIEPPITWIGA
jgi:hypothetical protein